MKCTICNSEQLKQAVEVKDNSVSKEVFTVAYCATCYNYVTVDPPSEEAIGPYYESEDYVSHTDTKQGLIHKLYHSVREYSLRKKLRLIQEIEKGKRLLDYGCGTGEFLKKAKEDAFEIQGIEPNPTASAIANKKGITTSSPEKLKELKGGSFDVITLWHVLEHVHELNETLREFHRLLKPSGKLIIAVPNINSYDAKHYKETWAALDVPRHLYHFTPAGNKKLIEDHGFKQTSVKGMPFDSFYVSMLSEKYLNKSPMPLQLIKAFIIGLYSNIKAGKTNYSSNIYIYKKS